VCTDDLINEATGFEITLQALMNFFFFPAMATTNQDNRVVYYSVQNCLIVDYPHLRTGILKPTK
jgi:hypothetical protein